MSHMSISLQKSPSLAGESPVLSEATKAPSPLSKNALMITSIALGVLFALFFTGVVVASVLATHGVAIPVFAFLAVKMAALTSVGSVIGSKILYGLFFGGILNFAGAIVGKIYKLGETRSMEKFLLTKIFPNGDKSQLITPLSEKRLNQYKLKRHGTIFSCQSGHNFRKLDITKDWMCGRGLTNKIKNIFTFIGHMFILDPYESFKSLLNFKKYLLYKNTVLEEKRLKEELTPDSAQALDKLFSSRIEELILSKSIPCHNQYLINPELTVLDRFIAISEAALDSKDHKEDESIIKERIARLKAKKQEILGNSSKADGFSAKDKKEGSLFYASNLLEINEKIDALTLSSEYKMQIREAVSILLTHPKMTIDDVNLVVGKLVKEFSENIAHNSSNQWQTRESSINYAVARYDEKHRHEGVPLGQTHFTLYTSLNKSPMSVDSKTLPRKIARSFLTDLAICLLPGAPIAAFLWTSLAISFSKHVDKLNTKPVSPRNHRYTPIDQA